MFSASPLLLADLFDRFRLQLPDPIVNWLTPVWILCIGATLGLVLTAALWGIFWLLSRIPGVGTLADRPRQRWVAVAVVTVLFFLGLTAWHYSSASHLAAEAAAGLVPGEAGA